MFNKLFGKKTKNLNASVDSQKKDPAKDPNMIKVFDEVVRKKPETKLYILGKYDLSMPNPENLEENLEQLILRLKIPKDNLIFVGEVKDVSKYYVKACVNLMTSEREGFGLPILEAGLFGIPSIVFDGGGVGELVTDMKDGFVIENGNIQEMADKTISLLNEKSILHKFSIEAYKKTIEYSEGKILSKWRSLIDHVVKLDRKDLEVFLDTNYRESKNRIPVKLLKDIVLSYEEILSKQRKEEVELDIVPQHFSILSKPRKLISLIRKQGILLTSKNIFLKIKYKLFRKDLV